VAVPAGIAVACGDVWRLVAATALGAGLMRSRMAERKLTQALGDQYERFAVAARRWFPSCAERTMSAGRPVRPGQGDAIRAAVAATVV